MDEVDRRRHWATSGLAAQGTADPPDPFPHPPVVTWAFWVDSLHSLFARLLDHAVLLFRWLRWVRAFRVARIIEIRGHVGIRAWLCILGIECGGCRFLMISCHACTPLIGRAFRVMHAVHRGCRSQAPMFGGLRTTPLWSQATLAFNYKQPPVAQGPGSPN